MVCRMAATPTAQSRRSGDTFRVRWDAFDSLTEAKGATTTEQKAELAGVHRATLHRYRRGEVAPSLAFVMTAAARLNVSAEALIIRDAA